jgi:hypothetical protein
MAYKTQNLSVLAYAGGMTLWNYHHNDDTVDRALSYPGGYFSDSSDMVRVGDQILCTFEGASDTPTGATFFVNKNEGGVVGVRLMAKSE